MKIVPFWPGKSALPILDNVILYGRSTSTPFFEHAGYGLMAIRKTDIVVWMPKGTFIRMDGGGMKFYECPRVRQGSLWLCRSFLEFIRKALSR